MPIRMFAAILLIVLAQPSPHYFRYERQIPVAAQGQTCATIDVSTFAHAAPGLADLRVYRDAAQETPYVLHIAAPVVTQQAKIQLLNLGSRNGSVVFDAEMPQGTYSTINLDLAPKNFIATVAVSGSQMQDAAHATRLGTYNVFDLSEQRLGRSTVLHLPVSDFRYLHFTISAPIKPETVAGVSIESGPVQPAEYLSIAETSQIAQPARRSVIKFSVPANVPVERIEFVPAASVANFSRDVSIEVDNEQGSSITQQAVTYRGEIRRIHGMHGGRLIDNEQLAIKIDGANAPRPSKWTVTIDNGDDRPIALRAVRLQMQKRDLCFDAVAGAKYTLFYGDPALSAPRYDYASFFQPDKNASLVKLAAEQANPQYEPRPDQRPFTEKHPVLLWAALVLVVIVLGGVALRSAKQVAPKL